MEFLVTLGLLLLILTLFALGPVIALMHTLIRSDWQPVSSRNLRWSVVVMLIPLTWIVYFVVTWRRGQMFGDDEDF